MGAAQRFVRQGLLPVLAAAAGSAPAHGARGAASRHICAGAFAQCDDVPCSVAAAAAHGGLAAAAAAAAAHTPATTAPGCVRDGATQRRGTQAEAQAQHAFMLRQSQSAACSTSTQPAPASAAGVASGTAVCPVPQPACRTRDCVRQRPGLAWPQLAHGPARQSPWAQRQAGTSTSSSHSSSSSSGGGSRHDVASAVRPWPWSTSPSPWRTGPVHPAPLHRYHAGLSSIRDDGGVATAAAAAAAAVPALPRPWAWPPPRCAHSSAATLAARRGPGPGAGIGGGGGGLDPGEGEDDLAVGAPGGGPGPGPGPGPVRDPGLGAPMDVFDRALKSRHRDRSARLLDAADPLLGIVADRLLDRLEDCRRKFPTAVVLGGAAVPVVERLLGGRAGIEEVLVVDSSTAMLQRIQGMEAAARATPDAKAWPLMHYVAGDEEFLPLKPGSVDVIISCLGLHWANDLPGVLAQCRLALKPDGLVLCALFGGETLQELRIACSLAQMEREGGVSPVVSPLAQVRDAGNLLTRADLRLPTVDVDTFRLGYPSALELIQHLRAMGEGNANLQRRRRLSRDVALAAAAVYKSMFGDEEGNSVTATYQVIFMTGWAPSPHQPKAAKRGSATVSFQDLASGLVEQGGAVGGTADGGVVTHGNDGQGSGEQQQPPGKG